MKLTANVMFIIGTEENKYLTQYMKKIHVKLLRRKVQSIYPKLLFNHLSLKV